MKRVVYVISVLAFAVSISVISFAQESGKAKDTGMHRMMDKHEKMEKGEMKEHMPDMMMKKMMMQREIIAAQDGGVIVLMGNKLIKYDKDLNLIKEVELKMDMEAMAGKMKECMKMMEKGKMGE